MAHNGFERQKRRRLVADRLANPGCTAEFASSLRIDPTPPPVLLQSPQSKEVRRIIAHFIQKQRAYRYQWLNCLKTQNRVPDNSAAAGSVNTHAAAMFRIVDI